MFVHDSFGERLQQAKEQGREPISPDVSGLVGLATENGTWMAGAFHVGHWLDDRLRYSGGLMRPSITLDYYSALSDQPLGYTLDGWATAHNLDWRLGRSPWFVGSSLLWADFASSVQRPETLPDYGIAANELDTELLGLGLRLQHDSRNNQMSPRRGHFTKLELGQQLGSFGADFDYSSFSFDQKSYWLPQPHWVVAWRLRSELTDGDLPFFAEPFIQLRGIPALRYQGEQMALTDVETRIGMDARWSLVLFGGGGVVADSVSQFDDSDLRASGGVGFRYLVARLMGWEAGMDLARGPEEWAIYIQFGSGWLM